MEYPSIQTTQKILDYNLEDAGNERSIQEVIDDWKHDCETDGYENEEQMVQGLFNDFQSEWNEVNERADDFLTDNCSYLIVRTIEKLYKYYEEEFGDDLHKDTLVKKLDIIYYFQAEEKLREAVEKEEMNLDYWG